MIRFARKAGAVGVPLVALCTLFAVRPADATLSEVRLGNVIVDCAELPLQVVRNMQPCTDYYDALIARTRHDLEIVTDPLVELTNGMVFRCSELGDTATRLSECAGMLPDQLGTLPE